MPPPPKQPLSPSCSARYLLRFSYCYCYLSPTCSLCQLHVPIVVGCSL
eukprot:gene1546-931_t